MNPVSANLAKREDGHGHSHTNRHIHTHKHVVGLAELHRWCMHNTAASTERRAGRVDNSTYIDCGACHRRREGWRCDRYTLLPLIEVQLARVDSAMAI